MKALVALISGAFLASSALAQTPDAGPTGNGNEVAERADAPESGASEAPEAVDERRICRRVDGDVSSRLSSRRVCRTAAEWRRSNRSS
jgi:hypothetical protein